MKNPWIIISVIVVVLFGGAILLSEQEKEQSNEENNIGVEVVAHVKGNPDATVTLVEYSDLQCPACRDFVPTVEEVLDLFGDDISFEYKHFPLPFHANAVSAAVAAEAAGQQGKFFEYHDLLFANQEEWGSVAVAANFFIGYAEELGLEMETFKRHMNSSVLRDKVNTDLAEGRALGVQATPTFFLDGEKLDSQTFGTYQRFIEMVGAAANPEKAAELFGTEAAPLPSFDTSDVRFGI